MALDVGQIMKDFHGRLSDFTMHLERMHWILKRDFSTVLKMKAFGVQLFLAF